MSNYENYTSDVLVTLLKRGDELAYAEIFDRFWPLLHRNAERMLGNMDDANDIVQDVFATLWEKRDKIVVHTSLAGYLYAATRNLILLRIRRSKIANDYLTTLRDVVHQGITTTEQHVQEKELVLRFEAELSQLPPRIRQAFELSRIHDQSYKEIAQKMGLSDNTIKHHISRALKILRTKLDQFIFFSL